MSGVFIDRVYYRTTGTYPSGTEDLSGGWSKIPAASAALSGVIITDQSKSGIAPGNTRKKGNGNTFMESEKISVEFELAGVDATDFAELRAAFVNKEVDICLVDSANPTVGYYNHRCVLYPSPQMEAGKSYSVKVSGEGEQAAGLTNIPHLPITVSGVA